jgi:hypothetical protein
MQNSKVSAALIESALANLQRSFDERLSVLQRRFAGSHLRTAIRARAELGGKVKAGAGD